MIYQTMTSHDFVRAFDEADRSQSFSVNARRELFDFYEELTAHTGEDMELDVIAICCQWAEYTQKELIEMFGDVIDPEPEWDEEKYAFEVFGELNLIGNALMVEHIGEPDTYLVSE